MYVWFRRDGPAINVLQCCARSCCSRPCYSSTRIQRSLALLPPICVCSWGTLSILPPDAGQKARIPSPTPPLCRVGRWSHRSRAVCQNPYVRRSASDARSLRLLLRLTGAWCASTKSALRFCSYLSVTMGDAPPRGSLVIKLVYNIT